MANVEVRSSDIDKLVDKLARLELDLTPPERALLLFMLGVAADTIHHARASGHGRPPVTTAQRQGAPVVVTMTERAPSIEDEFATAFVAGGGGRMQSLTGSISIGPRPVDE